MSNKHPEGWSEVPEKGLLIYEDQYFKAKWIICGWCEGSGQTTNPSIDSHGISSEEFAEDPDFHRDYFAGKYDVGCGECNGSGKKLFPETPEGIKQYSDSLNFEYQMQAEINAERRMGC
jgi:hypothetical protein